MPGPAHRAPPRTAAHAAMASPRRARPDPEPRPGAVEGAHSSQRMKEKATRSCKHSHHSEKGVC